MKKDQIKLRVDFNKSIYISIDWGKIVDTRTKKILKTYKLNERIERTGNRVVKRLVKQITNSLSNSGDRHFSINRIQTIIEKANTYSSYEYLVKNALLDNINELFNLLRRLINKDVLISSITTADLINKELESLANELGYDNVHIKKIRSLVKNIGV